MSQRILELFKARRDEKRSGSRSYREYFQRSIAKNKLELMGHSHG